MMKMFRPDDNAPRREVILLRILRVLTCIVVLYFVLFFLWLAATWVSLGTAT